MKGSELKALILDKFREKSILESVGEDQDFFDVGASSLTIVDLQLAIEEVLKVSVPTSKLMEKPTIGGWVELYQAQIG